VKYAGRKVTKTSLWTTHCFYTRYADSSTRSKLCTTAKLDRTAESHRDCYTNYKQ